MSLIPTSRYLHCRFSRKPSGISCCWSGTTQTSDYPGDSCIHELFEAQVERTPEAIAVQFEGKYLTYRELNARANQLAHYLRAIRN